MKTKQPASSKKQNVTLRDLKTTKNPTGGAARPYVDKPGKAGIQYLQVDLRG